MIYIIAGQTASGKTKLALKFAQLIGGEIINGDAFQVYKHLNIGTAKPTKEEFALVPHHLFDIVEINHPFNIYEYQILARKKIDQLLAKKVPIIIVGGSGLYIRSVLFDYRFSQSVTVDMSNYLKMSDRELHEELVKIDLESSKKIHPNNRRRVLRAIEIFLQNGVTKSQLEQSQNKQALYKYTMVTLERSREFIEYAIQQRVIDMFASGLRQELGQLLKSYPSDSPGFKAIGYKEIIDNFDEGDDFLIDLIAKNTRQYAKRQNTFFNNQFIVHRFDDTQSALAFLLQSFQGAKQDE